MSGPYDKFEAAFETFQDELKTELAAFKQELLADLQKALLQTQQQQTPPPPQYPFLVDLNEPVIATAWNGTPVPNHIVTVMLANCCGGRFPNGTACNYIFQRPDELRCPYCGISRAIISPQYQHANTPGQQQAQPTTNVKR